MSWLFTNLLKWLSGGVLDRVLGHLEKRGEIANDKEKIRSDVVKEYIGAEIADRAGRRELSKAFIGSRVLVWPVALMLFALAIYFCAVVADSIFLFEWNVALLPPAILAWADAMIQTVFAGAAATSAGVVISRMWRR